MFAASSLTEVFGGMGAAFSALHPDVRLTFNFGSSSALVAQIGQGAPADVYASADEKNMATLVDETGTLQTPAVFATNRLEIIVAPGNPLHISGLADLARPDLVFVTAGPAVPIGAYTAQAFALAGVVVTPRSLEENAKAIVSKVAVGEADAGIVFHTDALAAGPSVAGISIPAQFNVIARYPVAAVKGGGNSDTSAAFIAFILSDAGQLILRQFGFGVP